MYLSTTCVRIVLACMFAFCFGPLTLLGQQGPQLNSENAMRVGSVLAESGQCVGSCFYVDERGYVATCLSNIIALKDVVVTFPNRMRYRVSGYVAASRARDIVLLELIDLNVKGGTFSNALKLQSSYSSLLDQEVMPWAGPQSVAAPQSRVVPKVFRVLKGDAFQLGSSELPADRMGLAPDTRWMWLSHPRDTTCCGGPVFNRDGVVVGMISRGPSTAKDVFSAIDVSHVIALIPPQTVKAKPIRGLKTWTDPDFDVQKIKPRQTLDAASDAHDSLGIALTKGRSLVERFESVVVRDQLVESESAEVDKSISPRQTSNISHVADIEKFQLQIASIAPEEKYQTTEKVRVPRERTVTRTVRDRDGKSREVEETETYFETETRVVTRLRHSARQLAMIAEINRNIEGLQQKVEDNTRKISYTQQLLLPYLSSAREQLANEIFFIADPLELRPAAEIAELQPLLTKVIEQGGAPVSLYIARALTHCRNRNFDAATADLQESLEVDAKVRVLTRAIAARIQLLKGEKTKAVAEMKSILRDEKTDERVLLVAARFDMDNSTTAAAAKRLQDALADNPHSLELKHGLAWLLSQSSSPNSKTAMSAATEAAESTGYTDWSSVSALAFVHAAQNRKDRADQLLAAAENIATPAAQAMCHAWREELKATGTIKRPWK